jgi:sorbose reductase
MRLNDFWQGAGTFFTVQWTVERLKAASRPGSTVMIASQASQHVCPGHLLSAYAASKGAVLAFARNLAMEVASHGTRVNTISPGSVNSVCFILNPRIKN